MVAVEGAAAGAIPLVAQHSGLAEIAAALEASVPGGPFSFSPGPGAPERIARGLDRDLTLPPEELARTRSAVARFTADRWSWDRTAEQLLAAGVNSPG
jgi:glycosyltransferase involved in cell wall biosynthesis